MGAKSIFIAINSFFGAISDALKATLLTFGIDPSKIGGLVNLIGLFLAGLITVLVVTIGIISYIKGTQFEPFYSSYEDDAFVRGKAGTVMGILTIICAVWFLFAIVYIYFVG